MTGQTFHERASAPTIDSSIIAFPPTLQLPPLTPEQRLSLLAEQAEFDRRFPPSRRRDDDILIVSWSEIQRQFLDLCAPWDQSDQAVMIRVAQQNSAYESAEKTLRGLFVLNHMRTSIDTPMPGTFRSRSRSSSGR